jgi:dynactin 1
MASKKTLEVGDRVVVNTMQHKGLFGHIRYEGTVSGSTGHWLGVELDTAAGRNSGYSEGRQYFECKENHGVFLRAT